MGTTSIEWTDRSVNPLRAALVGDPDFTRTRGVGHYCEKISAGCKNCYSSRRQPRFGLPPFEARYKDRVEPYFDVEVLDEVLARRTPTKWFWVDMSDLFGDWVRDEWIDTITAAQLLTPHHIHQTLTKRPERMRSYLTDPGLYERVLAAADVLRRRRPRLAEVGISNPTTHPPKWIWRGVSVEDQRAADERIPLLLETPAAVRFLSVEPLLGPVTLPVIHAFGGNVWTGPKIDWVIVGSESGPNRRNQDGYEGHARALIAQARAAGISVFHKQMPVRGRVSHDPAEWSEDLRVREFPR